MARAPLAFLAAVALLLAGSLLLHQAHLGRMAVSTSCVTPDPSPQQPDPAPVCRESGDGGWRAVGAAALLLLLGAGGLLARHAWTRRTRSAWVASLSLAALGLAALLFVAWLGAQGGSTLCIAEPRTPQDDGPLPRMACDPVPTAAPAWTVYAQGGWLAAALSGMLGCVAAPVLAHRDQRLTRAQRRRRR